MTKRHLVLFDDRCPLCWRSVALALKLDRHECLYFSSLWGETARRTIPQDLLEKNSFVLVENYEGGERRIWIYAKGIFRLFWLLGGSTKWLGVLHFLPSWLIDPFYRLIARLRPTSINNNPLKKESRRFLP